jgi:hypothetical protein
MRLKDVPFGTWCVQVSGRDYYAVCLLSETECVWYSLDISDDCLGAYTNDAGLVSMLANNLIVDYFEFNEEPECRCTYPANHDKACSWWGWKQEQRRAG